MPEDSWTEDEMTTWINAQSYEGLLRWWRFAPPGDPFFRGSVGKHYGRVMAERRAEQDDGGVAASKRIGYAPAPGSGPTAPVRVDAEHPGRDPD